MSEKIPSFNKRCVCRTSEGIVSLYMEVANTEEGLATWHTTDSGEVFKGEVYFWEYDKTCRDCDGTGIFYQIEGLFCHCEKGVKMKQELIKDIITPQVQEFLAYLEDKSEGYDIYLGGGYLRDNYATLVHGLTFQPKDVDIFFVPQKGVTDRFIPLPPKALLTYDSKGEELIHTRENVKRVMGIHTYRLQPNECQFIIYKEPMSMLEVAEDMDCNVNQIMYCHKEETLLLTDKFIKGHKNKMITMLHDFEVERMLSRVDRMKEKLFTYTITKNEKIDEYRKQLIEEQEKYDEDCADAGGVGGFLVTSLVF